MGIDGNLRDSDNEAKTLASEGSGSSGVDETSPEMLKNTPSNIARLADKIEQCEGRQKYLAQTRSPADGGDVRWYFCKVPLGVNELAAAVPRTEIVGKGEYFRFGMRDSLAIEASFLQREEELLSYWWKEYAECSEGPRARPSSSAKPDLQNSQMPELYAAEEERVGVPVKGGLYEVDLVKRHCFPVYWNGENRRVLRGHWFAQSGGLDWLPLREDIAEQLEFAYQRKVWHRRRFQPSGLFAARVDLQGPTQGLHALFVGEDDTWEAWLSVKASGFSNVVSLGGKGIKLRRGYAASPSPKPTQDELRQQKEEEMDDYCSQVPVRHLVFMIHGIGQRLEKSNLVDDVSDFREVTSSMAEKHLTSYQRGIQRILLIPCQWRKGLKLSGESAVENITLDGLRGLRTTLSATVHDVLYYMSPIYCQDIIDSVSNQLNRLYLKFLKRNPGYEGKVSLYGHSLGSVLSYDILCHQENLSSPFPLDFMCTEQSRKDESSQNISNQSSACNSKVAGTGGMSNAADDDKLSRDLAPLVLENRDAKVSLPVADIGPILPSVGDESTTRDMNNEMIDRVSSLPLNIKEPVCNSSPVFALENNALAEATSVNCETKVAFLENINVNDIAGDVGGKLPEKVSCEASDKDEEIIALKVEIGLLKARVAELESQAGDRDTSVRLHQGQQEIHASIPNKDDPGKHLPGKYGPHKTYMPYIKYTKLEFKVDTFFAAGSPLGVFLALRNVRIGIGKGQEYWGEENIIEEMPACQRMFNIFHPFDPVAYRIEPLICKEYVSKRPVIVPYHKGGKRLHIGFQDFTEDLAARSQAIVDQLNSVKVKVLTVCQSKNNEGIEEAAEDVQEEARPYGSIMMERLTGSEGGRVDHALQDKTFEHPYISAFGSHTNYWRDNDTALFLLKHLYRNIPPEPEPRDESYRGRSKVGGDEETPLTR
ncbi:hypothetical protein Nepgr_019298 [Nepenthes gracilis]|uniref:DDHD domain-containing protein n=1 Tax=Nepenthes gracilis TaxID=150966 RepID=A0AAD3XTX2_NEPGR|nr:hypothetical protein Nepgr_019298 [Nepenthes gracilis]